MSDWNEELGDGTLTLTLASVEPGNFATYRIHGNAFRGWFIDAGVILRNRTQQQQTVFYPWSSVLNAEHTALNPKEER